MANVNFTAFNLSPHSAYNQSMPDGSTRTLEGVDLGENTYGYCLENDMADTMMGNLRDATFLSKEACEERVGQADSGELPRSMFEAWNLDAPEATNGLPNSRDEAKDISIPAIDSLKPAEAKSETKPGAPKSEAKPAPESKPKSESPSAASKSDKN